MYANQPRVPRAPRTDMRRVSALLIAVLLGTALLCAKFANANRLEIGPATLKSVLAQGNLSQRAAEVPVARFSLDRLPVTNQQFLEFVLHHPKWRRDQIAPVFADAEYLSHWRAAKMLGAAAGDQPVTRVSWFAARAYCEAQGERLPSWYEWELAAIADEHQSDARADPVWQARILEWYSQPTSRSLARVGLGPANVYGVQDLHGLVWEWVEDFNALIVSGDSREQGDPDRLRFCGEGALSLADRENYALLMRVAFLSALEARSTARSLGFRCAADSP